MKDILHMAIIVLFAFFFLLLMLGALLIEDKVPGVACVDHPYYHTTECKRAVLNWEKTELEKKLKEVE